MSNLLVLKLSETATLPTRAYPDDAGADLYSNENVIVKSKTRHLIGTGIAVQLPKGCYGLMASRSGLSAKHCIDIGASVVDPSYRGELKVCFINQGEDDFEVVKGMKIAQLICQVYMCPLIERASALDATARGSRGFGSSGSF